MIIHRLNAQYRDRRLVFTVHHRASVAEQPPPPLVKVLKENKMAANTSRDPKKRTKRPTKKRKPAESDDMQNEPLVGGRVTKRRRANVRAALFTNADCVG